jgi:hypothetical protein
LKGNIGVCTDNGVRTENFGDVWTVDEERTARFWVPITSPQTLVPQNGKKSTSLSYFSASQKRRPAVHVYHTFHHNFTTR